MTSKKLTKKNQVRWAFQRVRLTLAGLPIKIIESPDPGLKDVPGVVFADRKNTLLIKREDTGRVIIVPKKNTVFTVKVGPVTLKLDGNKFIGRTGQRIKKKIPKW